MIKLNETDILYLGLLQSEVNEFEYQYYQKLYEKLYDINSQDLVLPLPYLRDFYDSLDSLSYQELESKSEPKKLQVISSGELTSHDCKLAHILNPIKINVYSICQPAYLPEDNRIDIGFPPNLSSILLVWMTRPDYNKNLKNSLQDILDSQEYLSGRDRAYNKNILTENSLIQTFYHELSHWLSDTFHNRNILQGGKKALSLKKDIPQHYKVPQMIFSPIEFNAYMHGIKVTRKLLGQEKWDEITLDDLFLLYPALYTIELSKDKSYTHNFKKSLVARMHREGLLGKNMRFGT